MTIIIDIPCSGIHNHSLTDCLMNRHLNLASYGLGSGRRRVPSRALDSWSGLSTGGVNIQTRLWSHYRGLSINMIEDPAQKTLYFNISYGPNFSNIIHSNCSCDGIEKLVKRNDPSHSCYGCKVGSLFWLCDWVWLSVTDVWFGFLRRN